MMRISEDGKGIGWWFIISQPQVALIQSPPMESGGWAA